ncbi:MAG TPA: hypothetical protein VMM36_11890 [Opitutaceae bacterium]|nr:hypothetical protein [Opitutaceae bacterium]
MAIPIRMRLTVVLMLLVAVVASSGSAAAQPKEKRGKKGPAVLVVSEATTGHVDALRPTPETPVYYVVGSAMERPIGGNFGLNMPTQKEVEEAIDAMLAREGFVRTQVGGPMPSIVLFLSWGEARLETWEYEEMDPQTGESRSVIGAYNREDIMRLIGADKSRGWFHSTSEADAMNSAGQAARFYVVVAALDAGKLRKGGKSLVWRVRMSIPGERTSLKASMHAMLESGAPFIGRAEEKPVFVDGVVRRPHVDLGEAKVIEFDAKRQDQTDQPVPPKRK